MSIFDKYASKIDAKELAESQKEIKDNASSGDYPEIPAGKYEVKVSSIEAMVSKQGNDEVVIDFSIIAGPMKGKSIRYYGVYKADWQRHRVAKFMSDLLDEGDKTALINLLLKGQLKDVNDFCLDVAESVDGKLEYLLDLGKTKPNKDGTVFNVYNIVDVYDSKK